MTFETLERPLRFVADVMTVLGLGGIPSYGALARDRNLLGRKIFKLLIFTFKFGLILVVSILMCRLASLPYALLLITLKGEATPFYWEDGKAFYYIIAYLGAISLMVLPYGLIVLSIGTTSLYYPKLLFNKITNGAISLAKYQKFSVLEILKATYGSNAHTADVTEVLRSMVESGKLRVFASNSLAGDPDPGVGKTLRVKYRINDVEHSAEIGEGTTLIIP